MVSVPFIVTFGAISRSRYDESTPEDERLILGLSSSVPVNTAHLNDVGSFARETATKILNFVAPT